MQLIDVRHLGHERGARHLIDPSTLLESARRLHGEKMDSGWGKMVPVPEGNIRALEGGERVIDGAFEVAYTPGHASHHVAYLDGRTAFVGDAGGVRITKGSRVVPPTPPPDIDLEAWHESIERLRGRRPERLAITQLYAGLERYWRKRAETAASPETGARVS